MHQMEHAFVPSDSRNKVLLGRNDPSGDDVPSEERGTLMLERRYTLITSTVQARRWIAVTLSCRRL
ncbi:MAG: hypothetical protein V7631_1010 [Massilia sp.]